VAQKLEMYPEYSKGWNDLQRFNFETIKKNFNSKAEKLSYMRELKYKMCDSAKDISDKIECFNYLSHGVQVLSQELEG